MRLLLAAVFVSFTAVGCVSRSNVGGEPSQCPPGRFQIATTPNPAGGFAAFVLDTATGQVWHSSQVDEFARPKLPAQPGARP